MDLGKTDWPDNEEEDYRKKGLPPEPPENGLSLIIGPDDGMIDNADVRVRWCITPELTAYLESRSVQNPHILLATFNKNGHNEWRGLFPLNQIMSFARFYQAGKQNIAAFIVDISDDTMYKREQIKRYMKHDYDNYNYDVQVHGNLYRDTRDDGIFAYVKDAVDIPAGVFGKEAPAWLDWYVNAWHGTHKNDDDCEFRKRALIGLVKWIPMLIVAIVVWAAVGIACLLFAGLGFASWLGNWKALRNPFDSHIASLVDSERGKFQNLRDSRFAFHIHWKDGIVQPVYSLLWLSPTVVGMVLWLSYIFHKNGDWRFDLFDALSFTGIFIMIFGLLNVFFDVVTAAVAAYHKHMQKDSYLSTVNLYQEGAITSGIILFIAFLIIVPPWWVLGITISIVVAIGIGSYISDNNVDTIIQKTYLGYFDKILAWVDSWFGSPQGYDEMRELLCPQDKMNLSTDINNIPANNRSWKLRARNLKASICKPRQRR